MSKKNVCEMVDLCIHYVYFYFYCLVTAFSSRSVFFLLLRIQWFNLKVGGGVS